MKGSKTALCFLLVAFLGWQSSLVNSAIIVRQSIAPIAPGNSAIIAQEPSADVEPALHNHKDSDSNNPNITVRLFQEAIAEYAELTNAYYAPAQDEAVREKRTINVIRNLANRTRSGFASLRGLFRGAGGSSSGGGFRTFFSNLINRILIFLTNLWDRITGFFRPGDGSDGASGAGGGLFARLGGIFRGGAGGGGLLSIFRPRTTTESYFADSDFSFYSSTSTTTEPPKETDLEDAVGINTISETKGKSLDDKDGDNDDEGDLVPFPADLSSRTAKALSQSSAASSPVALAVKGDAGEETSPHIVSSPSIIHLIDDGRRFA